METKNKLNLTHSMELTKIFQCMPDSILEGYVQNLKQRMQEVAVTAIEFGPGAADSFHEMYIDLKEVYERAEQQLKVRETVNKY